MHIFLWALLLIFSAIGVEHLLGKGFSNDTSALFKYAEYFVNGEGLYTDRIEVNPPFIMLLYAPVVLFQHYSGLLPHTALNIFTLFWVFCSLCLTFLLHRQKSFNENSENTSLLKNLFYDTHLLKYMLISVVILLIMPIRFSFHGDREHLLFIFALPWITAQFTERKTPLYITLFFCIGLLIKPYNFLIPAFFILAELAQNKKNWLRVLLTRDNIIFLIAGLSYIAYVYVYFPQYIFEVIPVALESYAFVGQPKINLFTMGFIFFGYNLFFGFFTKFNFYKVGCFALACSLIFILNGGWNYTFFVLYAPLCMFSFLALFNLPSNELLKSVVIGGYVTLLIVSSTTIVINYIADRNYTNKYGVGFAYNILKDDVNNDVRNEITNKRFLLISINAWSTNLLQFNNTAYNVLPFDVLWPLPWVADKEGRYQNTLSGKILHNSLMKAFENGQPDIIIVDTSPIKRRLPQDFSLLDYLTKQDPEFKENIKEYNKTKEFNFCKEFDPIMCRYEIWEKE